MGEVVSQAELILRRDEWKRAGKAVVCVSGSFDLLHPGHIRLLEQARSHGAILIVLVQNDASIRERFKPADKISRPITPCSERMEILAALSAVDYVVEIDDTSSREFLLRFAPEVFVEGASEERSGVSLHPKELQTLGCRIIRIPVEPGYSTARLLERIQQIRP